MTNTAAARAYAHLNGDAPPPGVCSNATGLLILELLANGRTPREIGDALAMPYADVAAFVGELSAGGDDNQFGHLYAAQHEGV